MFKEGIWFDTKLVSVVRGMEHVSHSSHWHAAEPQGVFRAGWTFSRASRIKWGQKMYWTCVSLGSSSFPKTFANTFALQTGIADFKFTNDKKWAETISRKYWFKSSWSLSGTAVINYSLISRLLRTTCWLLLLCAFISLPLADPLCFLGYGLGCKLNQSSGHGGFNSFYSAVIQSWFSIWKYGAWKEGDIYKARFLTIERGGSPNFFP